MNTSAAKAADSALLAVVGVVAGEESLVAAVNLKVVETQNVRKQRFVERHNNAGTFIYTTWQLHFLNLYFHVMEFQVLLTCDINCRFANMTLFTYSSSLLCPVFFLCIMFSFWTAQFFRGITKGFSSKSGGSFAEAGVALSQSAEGTGVR